MKNHGPMSNTGLQGKVVKSDFRPPWWASNQHVQTIWPRFFQKRRPLSIEAQRLELPDGDFVDLAWGQRPANAKGLVVFFHGLEGSVHSHYANDMMAHLLEEGYWTVLMHFRGCSEEQNRTTRAYHSGETQDAQFFLSWLDEQHPDIDKVAVGFSLGANMLLKLLGEQPTQRFLKAAVAFSPPLLLGECADSIHHGFSRFYERYLLRSMNRNLVTKMAQMDFSGVLKIDERQALALDSFREFDQHVTAPLHGFAGADDYYQRCSAMPFLKRIGTPTLIVHAVDDPFMSPKVVPKEQDLSPFVRCEISEKGGHVGFLQGLPWKPSIWMHKRMSAFLSETFGGRQ